MRYVTLALLHLAAGAAARACDAEAAAELTRLGRVNSGCIASASGERALQRCLCDYLRGAELACVNCGTATCQGLLSRRREWRSKCEAAASAETCGGGQAGCGGPCEAVSDLSALSEEHSECVAAAAGSASAAAECGCRFHRKVAEACGECGSDVCVLARDRQGCRGTGTAAAADDGSAEAAECVARAAVDDDADRCLCAYYRSRAERICAAGGAGCGAAAADAAGWADKCSGLGVDGLDAFERTSGVAEDEAV
eukprot:TRINITY_DN4266_c0_g1_i1.p1 TRINITY_DN4266_c0_g1~~TRINITY_DN4266_c0_g1_i1.p1  ORF type:complete len:254 (+),score=88.53 TRINITY_DN4266_c0_g1_i1:81-842(+)